MYWVWRFLGWYGCNARTTACLPRRQIQRRDQATPKLIASDFLAFGVIFGRFMVYYTLRISSNLSPNMDLKMCYTLLISKTTSAQVFSAGWPRYWFAGLQGDCSRSLVNRFCTEWWALADSNSRIMCLKIAHKWQRFRGFFHWLWFAR